MVRRTKLGWEWWRRLDSMVAWTEWRALGGGGFDGFEEDEGLAAGEVGAAGDDGGADDAVDFDAGELGGDFEG